MNLHISHDDKFFDIFIRRQRRNFSDSENIYLVYSDSPVLKMVKSENVFIVKLYSKEFWNFVRRDGIKKIFIHYFNSRLSEFVLKIPENIEVYWIFYGSDGFYLPSIIKEYLDEYSLKYIKSNQPHLVLNYFALKFPVTIKWKIRVQKHIEAIKRIDYFCHYIYKDYQLIKQKTGFNADFLEFNICSIEDLAKKEDKLKLLNNKNANAIFVGNSACENNNHISAFHLIKKHINNDAYTKVFCPLSYSGFHGYIKLVIHEGKKLFGDKFQPLLNYMKKDEYDKILSECFLFVNNHRRSQAYGNIGWQLYAGGEVAMNSQSNLYEYLTKQGIIISSLDNNLFFREREIKTKNAEIIENIVSEENVVKRYANLFK
ncbi:MAG TPA: TDP-N-acetylfucosamine:lipid II N-acetylfucosaminyltransferase [Bacteroidia bacterium]|nr:TDP-N-acetylfucosamine:lipid II N-acetylfucosaminyltransferase [Bacteroidia bacterium]HRS58099.1 TDP-N-acetylfucosamine:lipid II N-acetylfucosaminyltransferase [Bacteroidia bacterium]HRU66880.1 TDP-N-acetylfucosamine:lipid II N-acetylfucosaminyltransferase [Bacteroidia bacterium]